MIAILSGRYDIVHPGHIKTIVREAKRFEKLYVYVWDNEEERVYPAVWAAEMIAMAAGGVGNIEVILHPAHFGRCSKSDLENLHPHDVILSGNPEVTKHLRDFGEKVEEIQRTDAYNSSTVKREITKQYLTKLLNSSLYS